MSHSSLSFQQVDVYACLAQTRKQAYRPEQRALVGLFWSGRHCFVMVKVQLSGGKQTQEHAAILRDEIRLKYWWRVWVVFVFLHLNLTFPPECSERIL